MKSKVNLDGKEITLIGTAHVSGESVKEVQETIEEIKPDYVGIELDEDRLESLENEDGWSNLNIAEAIKQGKASILLVNLVLSIYQRRLGLDQDVKPGEELLQAVKTAREKEIKFELIDQEINITLSKAINELSYWEKIKIISEILAGGTEEEINVEDLKQQNLLETIVKDLEDHHPSLKKVFLDDRNRYMANKIKQADFEKGVIIVGAAHLQGIKEELEENKEPQEIKKPNKRIDVPWYKIFKYGFPISIIALMAYSFVSIGTATGIEATRFWIMANSVLAGIGAILAKSHVKTWVASIISAPLTSLYPALGAGMVAAYVEAKFHPPTVKELEEITKITDYTELWDNQVGIILLTFFLVSVGSAIATFAGAGFLVNIVTSV